MKNIGIVLVAALAALVLGSFARFSTDTAHADVDDTVVIGCEFLISAIDGNLDDAVEAADVTAACDGLFGVGDNPLSGVGATPPEPANVDTGGEIETLAEVLGDEDGTLEASDFEDIDLDANQIVDGGTQVTYAIAFVSNDGLVTFNAETGIVVTVVPDGGAGEALPAGDADPETCTGPDDFDCGTSTLDNGDGVVVATVADGTANPGAEVEIDITQDGETVTETVLITGRPDRVTVEAVLGKDVIQISGSSAEQNDCEDDSDVSDSGQLGDINRTFVKATVTDNDDVELTRAAVVFDSDDDDIASIDSDAGEISSDPKAITGVSVDAGAAGVGSFAVICGGTDTGVAGITATINDGLADEDDETVDINVVGEPDNVALTATPAIIDCDGTATSSVSATVTDSDGNNVANGTNVNFSVVALGTASPINVDTADGVASSTITPLSNAVAGVTVIVTSGDAQASIRVDCNAPAAGVTPGAAASPTPSTGIGGPDTGNGGYLGQDSAGFPMWTLVALALGSLALVGGGLVTRRAGK